ncbi:MAG: hypothetical protein KA206_09250 [Paludibacter sp.]|jgi:hypothetical protein|nr:hypothetical protein [Paludibacter sp.]
MTAQETNSLRTKIIKGINASYNKLLIATQKEDGELVVSKNGKVVRVKARDLSPTEV